MAIEDVFTGANGTLTLANESTPEGQDASAIMEAYTLQTVGRVTNVEICVQTDLEEFYQIGRRHPISLHAGNVRVSGKVGRAYINGALLWLLLGRGASSTNIAEPYVEPTLNMSVQLSNPEVPGTTVGLELQGVKFQNWAYTLPEDDFVMENITFKALTISVVDKPAPAGGGNASAIAPKFS